MKLGLRIRQKIVRWLLRGVRLEEQKFGDHTITVRPATTDVVRWSATQAATATGDLGMNATTGRPSMYFGTGARDMPYLDETGQGGFKKPVIVATTANISLSTLQTIDGITLVAGDRVLVKNQSTASENGIYEAATGSWTRSDDFDEDADAVGGSLIPVSEGTTNGNTLWQLTTDDPITVGTTGLAFTQLAPGGAGAHASTHITGQSDEIDGDKLDIDWNPTNYTPSTAPTEADNVDNLTAHLYGIDQALAGGDTNYDTVEWKLTGKPAVQTGFDGAWIAPRACTITRITLWRRTAGSSGSTIVDVNKNGTTVYTTQANRPTVTSGGGANAIDATTDMNVTSVAQNDRMEADIDSVELGNPQDITVIMEVSY